MQLFSGKIEPVTQAGRREAPAPVFLWCSSVVRSLLPLRYSLMGVQGEDELKAPWGLRWPSLLLRGAGVVGGILGLWSNTLEEADASVPA